VKHAGPAALEQLAPLLRDVRSLPGLTEKRPGVFYRRSRAFLHFHEDPAGLFADLRTEDGVEFDRSKVDSVAEWDDLVARIRAQTTQI